MPRHRRAPSLPRTRFWPRRHVVSGRRGRVASRSRGALAVGRPWRAAVAVSPATAAERLALLRPAAARRRRSAPGCMRPRRLRRPRDGGARRRPRLGPGRLRAQLDASLVPASNEKLAVTYAALVARAGLPHARPRCAARAPRATARPGTGNLVLKGYGDPTLDRAGLADLARRLRAPGSGASPGSWSGTSRASTRCAAARAGSLLLLEESPPLSALVVDRGGGARAGARRQLFRAGARARRRSRVAGPTKVARGRRQAARRAFSPPLDEILHAVDADSDNFSAELLLKELGAVAAGGTTADGAAVVRRVLAAERRPARRRQDRRRLRPLVARPADAAGARGDPPACWADRGLRPDARQALAVAGRRARSSTGCGPPARGNVLAKTGTTDSPPRSPASSAAATRSRSSRTGAARRRRPRPGPFARSWPRRPLALGAAGLPSCRRQSLGEVLALPQQSVQVGLASRGTPARCAFVSFDARAPRRRRGRSSSSRPSR